MFGYVCVVFSEGEKMEWSSWIVSELARHKGILLQLRLFVIYLLRPARCFPL